MSPAPVDWQTTLIAMTIGLAVGLFLVWRLWRARADAPSAASVEVRDLEAERDVLIAQLRELDDEADKLTPEQLQTERTRIEIACARIMRDLDRRPAARPAAKPTGAAAPSTLAHRPALRGFVWGVVAVSAVAGLFALASRSATRREEPQAGGMSTEAGAEDTAGLESLKQAVAQDPQSIEARLALARAHLMRHEMMEVFQQTRVVLEREPDNPRALSYQALVRFAMGESDRALTMLNQALKKDPGLLDGWVHLIYVQAQLGRLSDAERSLAAATKLHPEHSQVLRSLLDDLRKQAPASPPPAMEGQPNPHAGLDQPAAKAENGSSVSGTVTLAPGVSGTADGVLFIVARPAGVERGTPVAAKRLDPTSWPIAFTLSSGDSMMGESLPAKLRIEARLDTDGNVATRDPKDPVAVLDNVALGNQNLSLILKTH